MNQPIFQYYRANIKQSNPLGLISLERFYEAIRSPKENIREVYTQIKQAEQVGDMRLKADLKQHLYSFTPAVYVASRDGRIAARRRYSDIHNFTGLMPLDFDHLQSESYAEEFKEFLFREFPYIVATWLSASRLGVRALVRIPRIELGIGGVEQGIKDYQGYFNGLASEEMAQFTGFDFAPKNAVLPLFLSWDKDILTRPFEDTAEWIEQYFEPEPVREELRQRSADEVNFSRNEKRVTGLVRAVLSKITDNGHLPLRSISYIVGGYVGGGEVGQLWAEQLLFDEINSHWYLRQKADTYKRTAREMIQRGKLKPMRLD